MKSGSELLETDNNKNEKNKLVAVYACLFEAPDHASMTEMNQVFNSKHDVH